MTQQDCLVNVARDTVKSRFDHVWIRNPSQILRCHLPQLTLNSVQQV